MYKNEGTRTAKTVLRKNMGGRFALLGIKTYTTIIITQYGTGIRVKK